MTFQKAILGIGTIVLLGSPLVAMNQKKDNKDRQEHTEMKIIDQEKATIVPVGEDGDYFKINTINNSQVIISFIKKNSVLFKTHNDAHKFLELKSSVDFTAINGIALGERGCLIALACSDGSIEFHYWNVQKDNHSLVGVTRYPIRKVATPVGNVAVKIISLKLKAQNILVTTNYLNDVQSVPFPKELFSNILALN